MFGSADARHCTVVAAANHDVEDRLRSMQPKISHLMAQLRKRFPLGRSRTGTQVGDDLSKIFADSSGWTVFDDVALRLKSLTTEELEASAGDPGALPGAFKIRLASTVATRREANKLVSKKYSNRGLQTAQFFKPEPHLFTFVAYDEGALAGTVSIRLDSPDGLYAEQLYPSEIEDVRKQGFKVCEFTRLAVDASRVSKAVIAALFHTAYLYAYKLHGFDFSVIEVNPRHVAYYLRALGFEILGPERHNARVNAPAVLLCTPFEAISESLRKYAGKPGVRGTTHSLFVYGFTEAEEAGILGRLQSLDRA
jgi:hypothetical protein